VVEKGITPRVNTGIAHKEAGVGQIGAGLVRPPMAMFEQALVAFAEEYGYYRETNSNSYNVSRKLA
jgi:hypothetical protein